MEPDFLAPFSSWLDSFLNFERLPQKNLFWLDTMQYMCGRLGNPERAVPGFHVAGSKGKGSISCMIASILDEAGYTAGLYTSPHLHSIRERVCLPGAFFPDSVYAECARELEDAVAAVPEGGLPAGRPLTWFELVTLFGMLCFRRAGADYAVYEVGLGGRLDATNVITPLCSCIGPIELEHTEYLGNTLPKIAAEKGGIIKTGVPVIVSPQRSRSVRKTLSRIASERGSTILFADKCSKVSGIVYKSVLPNGRSGSFWADERSLVSGGATSERSVAANERSFWDASCPVRMSVRIDSPLFSRPLRPDMRMLGTVQAWNAAVAALAVRTALPSVPEDAVERGLSKAYLPARFEIAADGGGCPFVVFDGAHTRASVGVTLGTLKSLLGKERMRRLHVLYASAADKDVEHIARLFRRSCGSMTLTRPGTAKQSDMSRLELAFSRAGISALRIDGTSEAFSYALGAARKAGEPLLVTGSFYLVAELRSLLASPSH